MSEVAILICFVGGYMLGQILWCAFDDWLNWRGREAWVMTPEQRTAFEAKMRELDKPECMYCGDTGGKLFVTEACCNECWSRA